MDAQNFWFSSGSAGGGGGGDQGENIGQSLRLRGETNCWLTRTFSNNGNQEVYTLSGWMKPSLNPVAVNQGGPMINLLGTGSGGNGQANFAFFQTTSQFFSNTTNNFTVFSASVNRAFRDPSAWYHVVVSYNSPAANAADRFRVWINGELQTFNAGATLPAQDADSPVNSGFREMFIGCFNATAGTIPATGFIADYYFLDGTVADETDFGRFNDNGVWVPVEYDGDADDYGANGYHLTFADPDNLGADTAPTGATGHTAANNWTVGNGFNTDPVGIFSNDLFTSQAPFNVNSTARNFLSLDPTSNSSPPASFDDVANNWAQGATAADEYCIWRPATPYENVTSIRFEDASATDDILVNGTSTGQSTTAGNLNAPLDITLPADSITLTSFAMQGDVSAAGQKNFWARLWLGQNGNPATVLVDNTGADYDSMQDSPTQNYATGNPLFTPWSTDQPTLGSANLAKVGGAPNGVFAGITPTQIFGADRHVYFEVKVSNYPTNSWFGWIADPGPNSIQGTIGPTSNSGTYAWAMSGAGALNSPAAQEGPFTGITWTPNITVSESVVAGWEWDGPNRRMRYYENGVLRSTSSQWAEGAIETFWFYFDYNNAPTTPWAFNFGQQPFIDQPAGTVAIQTQNLPTPTILDPRDHFDVVTWVGNGVDNRDITGLQFRPCLVWIKNRTATNLDYLVTDARMGNGRRLRCNTPNGNNAMQGTTDFLAFNADGFEIGDGAEVNSNTAPNDYVAWCWNAAAENTDNNDGDIQTSIRTDVDAGFSCIQFTGTTAGDSLGHGLNAEPEFAISKCLGVGATAWQIYHRDLGVGSFLPFTVSEMSNIANFWGAAADWNATTCGCSNNDSDNNRTNELMRWYVWHGVEGYSRFGSYTGNGNADGPFIYTGFTPRMVLIRAAQTGVNGQEPWFCYDTAREPTNVMQNALEWNSQNREGATQRDIDILSNGFKLRSAANQVNGNGTNYIYAAWAQMPFGGEDTPPATAR